MNIKILEKANQVSKELGNFKKLIKEIGKVKEETYLKNVYLKLEYAADDTDTINLGTDHTILLSLHESLYEVIREKIKLLEKDLEDL